VKANSWYLFLYYWFPTALYCAFIFFLSSQSLPINVLPFPHVDKLVHILLYTVLGVLFTRAYSKQWGRTSFFRVLLFIFIYGITDEFHQIFTDNRVASVIDVLADITGGVLGYFGFIRGKSLFLYGREYARERKSSAN